MSAEDIIIRRALLDDAQALSDYMNALADENLEQMTGLRPTPEEERAFVRKYAEAERAAILVALDGARIVGLLDLWGGTGSYNRHTGRVGLSVLAPYRRKGIVRSLLNGAVEEAKRWPDFCRIELEVVPWNEPAIRLYEAVGFVREGMKRKAGKFKGKTTDLLLMALVW